MKKFSWIMDRRMESEGRLNTWLAEKVGLSANTISNYRTGKTEPDATMAMKIASVLGFDIRECNGMTEPNALASDEVSAALDNLNNGKGAVVAIPLFPNTSAFMAALHQSPNGIKIDLAMAKEHFPAPDSIMRDGTFAVRLDDSADCDEDYGTVILWPWPEDIRQNGVILFSDDPPNKLYVRRVVLFERGRFVLKSPYRNSNTLMESDVVVIGVVKFSGKFE